MNYIIKLAARHPGNLFHVSNGPEQEMDSTV